MLAYGDNVYFGALKRKTIEKNGEKFKANCIQKQYRCTRNTNW